MFCKDFCKLAHKRIFITVLICVNRPMSYWIDSFNKVGHLLLESKSKLAIEFYDRILRLNFAIEFCDRILLSKVISKVSESWCRIWIKTEFRQ